MEIWRLCDENIPYQNSPKIQAHIRRPCQCETLRVLIDGGGGGHIPHSIIWLTVSEIREHEKKGN